MSYSTHEIEPVCQESRRQLSDRLSLVAKRPAQGYQLPSGTIVVTEGEESKDRAAGQVAIYARVSSHEHRANLERQAERLVDYCAARGYQVSKVVKEIGSGVNDNRAKFLALLED